MTEAKNKRVFKLVDLPPSANNLHKHFIRRGKIVRVKTDQYVNWLKAAIWDLQTKRGRIFQSPYHLEILVQRNWKSKRARDIDNLIKPISDALVKAGMVKDDSLAESVKASWSDKIVGIEITITEITQ